MIERIPYVGISGVVYNTSGDVYTHYAEHQGLFRQQQKRKLLLGVKAVHQTQYLDQPNEYGRNWYPVGEEEFTSAFREKPPKHLMQTAQVYFEPETLTDRRYLDSFTDRIFERAKGWMQAIQYDRLQWDEVDMHDYLKDTADIYNPLIILQCQKHTMETLGPQGAAERLATYAGMVDYVMFDSTYGDGRNIDTDTLRRFIEAGTEQSDLDGVLFGVSGGLDANAVEEALPELLYDYPDLSWDAESKLHKPNRNGEQALSSGLVVPYLRASVNALTRALEEDKLPVPYSASASA